MRREEERRGSRIVLMLDIVERNAHMVMAPAPTQGLNEKPLSILVMSSTGPDEDDMLGAAPAPPPPPMGWRT